MKKEVESNKFIVINKKNLQELKNIRENKLHISRVIQNLWDALILFNEMYEDLTGKELNQKYYVCNQDETYGQEIIDLILKGIKI